jgi:hypothetical protein
LREARFDDYEQIKALHVRNGFAARSRYSWLALWTENPAYQRRQKQWPIGWVLESNSGEINGWIGNIPLAYYFRKQELQAACCSPWIVDESCRGHSLMLLKELMNQKTVDLFISSTVGAKAEPVMNLFGNKRVPVGCWNKATFWIASYLGFAHIALKQRSFPLPGIMSYPISTFLLYRDRFLSPKHRSRIAISEIETCSRFDFRFDEFWNELKTQRHDVLLAVRTQETLEWHFRDKLVGQEVFILTFSHKSRIHAYAVFDREDTAFGLKRVRLVDFQALGNAEEMLGPMLHCMIQKCRASGIHILEVTGCWPNQAALSGLVAPYERPLPSWVFYYKGRSEELSRLLADPRVWVPSSFDGDSSI